MRLRDSGEEHTWPSLVLRVELVVGRAFEVPTLLLAGAAAMLTELRTLGKRPVLAGKKII